MNDLLNNLNLGVKLSSFTDNANKLLKAFYFYLALSGIFGFSAFIMEESIQVLVFADFSASDTRSYALMKSNLEKMHEINSTLKVMTRYTLWLIPPQQIGYAKFAEATDLYIETLRDEIFANQPILFIGEPIDSVFTYQTYHPAKNGLYVAVNKRVRVVLPGPPAAKSIQITGIARPDPEKSDGIVIDMSGV